jgi:hypothetical protein
MTKLKTLGVLCLLVALSFAFPSSSVAQTIVTQIPTTCTTGTLYLYYPQAGAYSSAPSGQYVCGAGNQFLTYGGSGGNTQVLLASYTNATNTASAIFTFPVLASTNYQFSCTFYWQNSGTNANTWTLTTPSSPTNVIAFASLGYNATNSANTAPLTGSPLALTGTAAAAGATTYKATIDGTIQNGTTAGNIVFEGAASSGTLTVLNGSYCSNKSNP